MYLLRCRKHFGGQTSSLVLVHVSAYLPSAYQSPWTLMEANAAGPCPRDHTFWGWEGRCSSGLGTTISTLKIKMVFEALTWGAVGGGQGSFQRW